MVADANFQKKITQDSPFLTLSQRAANGLADANIKGTEKTQGAKGAINIFGQTEGADLKEAGKFGVPEEKGAEEYLQEDEQGNVAFDEQGFYDDTWGINLSKSGASDPIKAGAAKTGAAGAGNDDASSESADFADVQEAKDRLKRLVKRGATNTEIESAKENLKNLGVSDKEIEKIQKDATPKTAAGSKNAESGAKTDDKAEQTTDKNSSNPQEASANGTTGKSQAGSSPSEILASGDTASIVEMPLSDLMDTEIANYGHVTGGTCGSSGGGTSTPSSSSSGSDSSGVTFSDVVSTTSNVVGTASSAVSATKTGVDLYKAFTAEDSADVQQAESNLKSAEAKQQEAKKADDEAQKNVDNAQGEVDKATQDDNKQKAENKQKYSDSVAKQNDIDSKISAEKDKQAGFRDTIEKEGATEKSEGQEAQTCTRLATEAGKRAESLRSQKTGGKNKEKDADLERQALQEDKTQATKIREAEEHRRKEAAAKAAKDKAQRELEASQKLTNGKSGSLDSEKAKIDKEVADNKAKLDDPKAAEAIDTANKHLSEAKAAKNRTAAALKQADTEVTNAKTKLAQAKEKEEKK